jgi:hypothetical protein
MWESSRVINNRQFHPFLWSWYILAAIVLVYFSGIGLVYFLSLKEKNNPHRQLYEKTLETRREELVNFKLGGLDPFVWKPMFNCQSLEDKTSVNKTNKECIKTSLKFIKKTDSIVFNQFNYISEGKVERHESIPEPCLICHSNKSQKYLKWTFDYQIKKPIYQMASIWDSKDFLYFNLSIIVFMFLYLLLRLFLKFSRSNDLMAVAIKTGNQAVFENIMDSKFKKDMRLFLYIEISSNFISGYIPRRNMLKLYKKYFTGEFNFSELDLRIGIVEYNNLSFEGLRIAQGIASKASSSNLIVQDKALAIESGQDVKKAIWKRKNSQLEFNVIDFKKDK